MDYRLQILQWFLARCARCVLAFLSFTVAPAALGQPTADGPNGCESIPRKVPPPGIAPPDEAVSRWESRLADLANRLAKLEHPLKADVEVLSKACRWAIDFHEFYKRDDFGKVDRLLELAQGRMRALETTVAPPGRSTTPNPPWAEMRGRTVRGFRSRIDGTPQPVGLVFGSGVAELAQRGTVPLYVWLHGRGDKTTDLHFLCERLDRDGQIAPPGAIVLHPFGRQCLGYKSAGETDVMEAIDWVCEHYPVDQDRIVLMGFSMGGAGVWHLAAHYADRFVAASPGAGFAETARYQRLTPDQYPPPWVQVLWRVYDVPGYTRNLFNLPVVAYSGELDKQIQAARVMEEAFEQEGRRLDHIIGPGMGHKYHPDSLAEILARMQNWVTAGRPRTVDNIHVQTHHWRYGKMRWITVDGIEEPYADTRVDAHLHDGQWRMTTQNVSRLRIASGRPDAPGGTVEIDGQPVALAQAAPSLLVRQDGRWQRVSAFPTPRKHPGISGPIDDAFLEPFLVVLPTRGGDSAAVRRWVRCESQYIEQRWRYLFRGQMRVKRDVEVTDEDLRRFHLVIWGTPQSNALLARFVRGETGRQWPFRWEGGEVRVGQFGAPGDQAVLVGIYPNPLVPDRYVVLNSGPTFRDAHDRTNSLQNPQLPDWAILSLDSPRTDAAAGRVLHCGVFDDSWQLLPTMTWSAATP
ncbi:MAG: hypothetical protein D6753_11025 [Planctomycetota bacterium]|nr:MAG: hypothetical protein D6753_11025 [Planctomycetota bacterium]